MIETTKTHLRSSTDLPRGEIFPLPVLSTDFEWAEVERMAVSERGRWDFGCLRDGWRYGKTRDNEQKLHDCTVPWKDLPDEIQKYDRDAVRAFPEILAKAGLEVRRRSAVQEEWAGHVR